jgi:hypothetical protein
VVVDYEGPPSKLAGHLGKVLPSRRRSRPPLSKGPSYLSEAMGVPLRPGEVGAPERSRSPGIDPPRAGAGRTGSGMANRRKGPLAAPGGNF